MHWLGRYAITAGAISACFAGFASYAAYQHNPMGEFVAPDGGVKWMDLSAVFGIWFGLIFFVAFGIGVAWRVLKSWTT